MAIKLNNTFYKIFLSFISQAIVTLLFYFDIKNNDHVFLFTNYFQNYSTIILFITFFIFLLIGYLIYIINNRQNALCENYSKKQHFLYMFLFVVCLICSFFILIGVLVFLITGADANQKITGFANVLHSIFIYFFALSSLGFVLCNLFNNNIQEKYFINIAKKRTSLTIISISFLYAWSSLILPLLSLLMFLYHIKKVSFNFKTMWLGLVKYFYLIQNFCFTILMSVIFYNEFYFISTGDMHNWETLFPRAVSIFIFLYLPLRLFTLISEKSKKIIYAEIILAALFFISQILIIDFFAIN